MRYQSPQTVPCSVSPQAKLLDSQARVTNWFNSSVASLVETTPDGAPFSLTVRQDLVNAVVTTLVPKEELVILLRFVVSPTVGEHDSHLCHLPTERKPEVGTPSNDQLCPPFRETLILMFNARTKGFP